MTLWCLTVPPTYHLTDPPLRSSFILGAMASLDPKRILRVIWFIAIVAVIIGSLLPGNSGPMRLIDRLHIPDKVEHFLAYAVLTFLPTIHERRGFIIAAAIGAVALGVGLEFAQLYSGWRDFEVGDMVADTAGVLAGAAGGIPMRSIEVVRPLLSPPRGEEVQRRQAAEKGFLGSA